MLNPIHALIAAVIYAAGTFSISVPKGWTLLSDSVNPRAQHVYVFTNPSAPQSLDGLWIQSEAVKHRTLAQFVLDYKHELMAPLPVKTPSKPAIVSSAAHEICAGKQAAWLLKISDGTGLGGTTVLAVNATAAVSASYLHSDRADAAVIASLDSLCLK